MVKKIVELQQFTGKVRSTYCGKPRIPDGEGGAGTRCVLHYSAVVLKNIED